MLTTFGSYLKTEDYIRAIFKANDMHETVLDTGERLADAVYKVWSGVSYKEITDALGKIDKTPKELAWIASHNFRIQVANILDDFTNNPKNTKENYEEILKQNFANAYNFFITDNEVAELIRKCSECGLDIPK